MIKNLIPCLLFLCCGPSLVYPNDGVFECSPKSPCECSYQGPEQAVIDNDVTVNITNVIDIDGIVVVTVENPPQTPCPQGLSRATNGLCICPSPLALDSRGNCVTVQCQSPKVLGPNGCKCPQELTPEGENCVCPAGQVHLASEKKCAFPACEFPSIRNSQGKCVCRPGQTLSGSKCVCIAPTKLTSSGNCEETIACGPGFTLNQQNKCVCLAPAKLNGSKCEIPTCKSNELLNDTGVCTCKTPLVRQGADCVYPPCKPGETRNSDGACTCKPPMTATESACVCKAPLVVDSRGNCVANHCPSDRTYNSKTDACVCKPGTEDVNGCCLPVCSQNTKRDCKGNCVAAPVCKQNETLNACSNACICKAPFVLVDGECRKDCKPLFVWIDGQCKLPTCKPPKVLGQDGKCYLPQCKPGQILGKDGKCCVANGCQACEPWEDS